MPSDFTQNVIKIIKNIPIGKVLTYGRIAKLAGNPRAARQVSWLLHS
ncbi:MAG: MGMT family protein, partial [Candidatus Lokiarchaeota archaeon]|nr:MGMT family protein [Candidatus Lokiarchaeota archaeon]